MTTPAPTDITPSNVLQGPADIFIGAFGATEPATTSAVIDSTVWTFVGATDGGATLTLKQTYSKKVVDQVALPVGSTLSAQELTVATSLAEATLANIRRVLNDTATGTSFELNSEIANTEPTYAAVLLQGRAPAGNPRNVIVRRALSTADLAMAWKKDGMTVLPITFEGYYVSKSVKAFKVDDAP